MNEYRAKLGENGRIIIPAQCRKQLQLEQGEELILRVENAELHIFSLKHSLKKAQALVKRHAKNKSLVEKLRRLRLEDTRHE
jgi:AbrB family looped-hinge helix DNA binding protein